MQHLTDLAVLNEEIGSRRPVVVDFCAVWCGPCKRLEPLLDEAARNAPGTRFFRVDVDAVPDAADKHGVTALPTVVAFANGTEVGRVEGLLREAIRAMIDGLGAK